MPKKIVQKRKPRRREARDLDIEISFLEGVVRRDPSFLEALQVLGDDYTRRGRFEDGLKIDQRLAELRPSDSLVHYNLACSFALTEKMEEAFHALETALNLGYRDFRWLSEDPDLDGLRRHPLFRRIRDKVRTLQVKAK